MRLGICFTNFGPYHLARLRSLAGRLRDDGGRLIAYEVAGSEAKYPWQRRRDEEPFDWVTLFAGSVLEALPGPACKRAIAETLDRDRPDAVAVVGYARPESMAALRWALRRGRPTILMSESQAIDRPRVWWKESIKRARVRRFDAALVGGPTHRDYLVELGMPAERIALGYNAVDHEVHAARADQLRASGRRPDRIPARPYFLAVSRLVPEKDLPLLVRAFARYRREVAPEQAWNLVLCGDGPERERIAQETARNGVEASVHRPGFLQEEELAPWFAFASAFVLPSRSEPWGLVANEAAASGLPLIVSEAAGCAGTLVPDPPGSTGWRFPAGDEVALSERLVQMASWPRVERHAMGCRVREVAALWGPSRFAEGTMQALRWAVMRTDIGRERAAPMGPGRMR